METCCTAEHCTESNYDCNLHYMQDICNRWSENANSNHHNLIRHSGGSDPVGSLATFWYPQKHNEALTA